MSTRLTMSKKGTQTVVIQARVKPELRDNTDIIFERMGINRSEAIKIFLNHVEMHRGLPFAMKVPNNETLQVFENTEKGKNLNSYESSQDLFDSLEI